MHVPRAVVLGAGLPWEQLSGGQRWQTGVAEPMQLLTFPQRPFLGLETVPSR